MKKIAITGNIGSGKSWVCELWSQRLGIPVYNSDTAAKQMYFVPEVRKKLVERFGRNLLKGAEQGGMFSCPVRMDAGMGEKVSLFADVEFRRHLKGFKIVSEGLPHPSLLILVKTASLQLGIQVMQVMVPKQQRHLLGVSFLVGDDVLQALERVAPVDPVILIRVHVVPEEHHVGVFAEILDRSAPELPSVKVGDDNDLGCAHIHGNG